MMNRTTILTLAFAVLLVGCGGVQVVTEPPPDFAPESDSAVVPEQPPIEEILEDISSQGGGASSDPAAESGPIPTEPDEFSPYANLFEETIFDIDVSLPTDLHSPMVYVAVTDSVPEISELEATSGMLGFDGRVYERRETAFQVDPETGEEFVIEFPEEFDRFYSAFGNNLRADFFGTGFSYYDTDVFGAFSEPPDFMSYQDAKPLVEESLSDVGLLDFDYFIEEGFGNEVVVKRFWPEIGTERVVANALVLESGDIASLNYTYSPRWEEVAELPQVTADVAWLRLIDEPNRYEYIHRPEIQEVEQEFREYQRWVREREVGEVFNTIIFPEIYDVAGSDEVVLVAEGKILEADPSMMAEIAKSGVVESGIRVAAEARDTRATNLRILSWEPIDFVPSAFIEGSIAREDGLVKVVSLDGNEYYLENVPNDVPDDLLVFVDGTEITQTNEWFLLDWTVIYEQSDPNDFLEAELIESAPPVNFETVTIQEVYPIFRSYFGPVSESLNDVPLGVYREPHIPMWAFSGVTQEGDPIEFFVPAVILPEN